MVGLILAIALAVPASYVIARLQFERGTLTTTAQTRTYLLTQYIARNPQYWQFEEDRLLSFVNDGLLGVQPGERRRVLGATGKSVVENTAEVPAAPVIAVTLPIFDAGRQVGLLVVERSIRPLVVSGVLISMASLAVALLMIWLVKVMPLRVLRRSESALRFRAEHDMLTQLRNRESFRESVSEALSRARASGAALVVAFIDLDHFKRVNDAYGHDAGDAVLCEVARRLRTHTRSGDVVARLSGDEFAILAQLHPETTDPAPAAVALAEMVVRQCATPIQVDGRRHHIGASVGTATYPGDGHTVDGLLAHADTAMLAAKRAGRGQFCLYDASMQEARRARMELEADLRRAVEAQDFSLHFQPLVDLNTATVRGAEVLLRWQHPVRGMVPPMEFIPVLEDMGLIQEVGRWVLRRACELTAGWIESTGRPLGVSVNVSPLQFALGDDWVNCVRDVLLETGLRPAHLQLEITEGLLMGRTEHTLALMQRLRSLGVSLAIDDFGTGYSSLAYLHSFPVDTLKIDRSFVRDLGPRPQQATLVKAIIGLGHNLGMKVTAEGIETQEQRRLLCELGCDTGQGYLLGRPMPIEVFEQQLSIGGDARQSIDEMTGSVPCEVPG